MTDPWGYDNGIEEIDRLFYELEVEPNNILNEEYRNNVYQLLKHADSADYRIDFINLINGFPELNSDSHAQQQVVRMAILFDLGNKEWLDRLGQYVDGTLAGNWEETPGYNALETDDEALTMFRQQLYTLLS